MFRFENEEGYSVLTEAKIEAFNHNVVLKSFVNSKLFSQLMIDFHIKTDDKNPIVSDTPLHLVSEDFLIVINNPIFERLELDTGNMVFNIISDCIEYYPQPTLYMRKTKIKKIKKDIDARKKDRSSSDKRIQV